MCTVDYQTRLNINSVIIYDWNVAWIIKYNYGAVLNTSKDNSNAKLAKQHNHVENHTTSNIKSKNLKCSIKNT